MDQHSLTLQALQRTNQLLRQLEHQQLSKRQREVILQQVAKVLSTLQNMMN